MGLPFAERGRTRAEGLDCWGLARLILAERFGVDLPSYSREYRDTTDKAAVAAAVQRHLPAWTPVAEGHEREGDVVLMESAFGHLHMGVVVRPGVMIHIERGAEVTLCNFLINKIYGQRPRSIYRPPSQGVCGS